MSDNNSPINIIGIDNNLTLETELKRLLNPISFQLQVAKSFEQGEKVLRHFDADVLVISASISQEDRLSICRKFKSICKTPILVLSNTNKPGILEQTLDAGADEFIIKPISGSLLTAHLNTLARRFREEKAAGGINFERWNKTEILKQD